MKTMLDARGQINIPDEIRHADHLVPGDAFDLKRLTPGHYHGVPVIQTEKDVITSRLVKELESQMP